MQLELFSRERKPPFNRKAAALTLSNHLKNRLVWRSDGSDEFSLVVLLEGIRAFYRQSVGRRSASHSLILQRLDEVLKEIARTLVNDSQELTYGWQRALFAQRVDEFLRLANEFMRATSDTSPYGLFLFRRGETVLKMWTSLTDKGEDSFC